MMAHPLPNNEIPAIAELAQRRQWVCWRLEKREGKPTKVPVQPNGILAATDNPRTWSGYEEVVEAATRNGWGIGYVFSGDCVGVDLDKCRDPATDKIDDWAVEIIGRLRSYTEVSPSGTGVHILCLGVIPRDGGRRGQVEVYTRRRFFCVTGQHVDGWPDEVCEAEEALEWLWATHIRRTAPEAPSADVEPGDMPWDKFDAILENDEKFRKTWLHKRPDLQDQSLSTFDFSLCVLAAQTGWNDSELAALVVHHRRKWGGIEKGTQRKDYVSRTVANTREALRRRLEGNESLGAAMAGVMARERAEETLEGGQDAALQELRARLGLPIDRVVIVGEKTAISYWIVLDDTRRIGLGDAGRVLDQNTMRRAAFAAVGKVIPTVKQPMWDATVMILQAAAEREEASDSDPIREIEALLDEYRDAFPCPDWHSDHADGEFEKSRPILRDGAMAISPREFLRWAQARGALLSNKLDDLRNLLRSAGATAGRLSRRIGPVIKCRFYWNMPITTQNREKS